MAVNKWLIVDASTFSLRNRYLLKINGSRDDVLHIFNSFMSECEVPFSLQNDNEFNWGLYYYDRDGKVSDKILREISVKKTDGDTNKGGAVQVEPENTEEKKKRNIEITNYFFEMMYPDVTNKSKNEPIEESGHNIIETAPETAPKPEPKDPSGTEPQEQSGPLPDNIIIKPSDKFDKKKVSEKDILNSEIKDLLGELNDVLGNLTNTEKEQIKKKIHTDWKEKIIELKNKYIKPEPKTKPEKPAEEVLKEAPAEVNIEEKIHKEADSGEPVRAEEIIPDNSGTKPADAPPASAPREQMHLKDLNVFKKETAEQKKSLLDVANFIKENVPEEQKSQARQYSKKTEDLVKSLELKPTTENPTDGNAEDHFPKKDFKDIEEKMSVETRDAKDVELGQKNEPPPAEVLRSDIDIQDAVVEQPADKNANRDFERIKSEESKFSLENISDKEGTAANEGELKKHAQGQADLDIGLKETGGDNEESPAAKDTGDNSSAAATPDIGSDYGSGAPAEEHAREIKQDAFTQPDETASAEKADVHAGMNDSTDEINEEKTETAHQEEPDESQVEEQPVEAVPQNADEQAVGNQPEPRETKPQEKGVINIAVIYSKNEEALLVPFEDNVKEVIMKTTKGSFEAVIGLKLGIESSAPDLSAFFKGVEGGSFDLCVLIDSPDIPRIAITDFSNKLTEAKKYFKIISKSGVQKKFIYVDLIVDVMLKKKNINQGK